MSSYPRMRIAGTGLSVPATSVTNEEMEQRFGVEPGWIERRTGIRSRPVAAPNEATSDFAIEAGRQSLKTAGVQASDIGLLLLATSTPDRLLPPTAPLVAKRLRLKGAGAVDVTGACSGFLYALAMGAASGAMMQKPVLVIGANVLTRRVNQEDIRTAALFGDGAGAVVLVPSKTSSILGMHLGSDGSHYDAIQIPAGRTTIQIPDSQRAFKHAVKLMAMAGRSALRSAQMASGDIDWWVPHQANLRIIREVGEALKIPMNRTIVVIDRYANSSAATIPIALADALHAGKIKRGHRILLTSVGAGMIHAGIVLRY